VKKPTNERKLAERIEGINRECWWADIGPEEQAMEAAMQRSLNKKTKPRKGRKGRK
jgi:hypothetical protein